MSQSLPVSTIDDGAVPVVSLAASSTSVDESGGQAILEVKQNVVSLADTLVTLNPSGTATLNSDYSLSSTSLIIPAGSREANTTLQAISDHIDEDTEEIRISIGEISGGSANENQLIVIKINDDDVSEFTVAASGGTSVSESGSSIDTISVVLKSEPTGKVAFLVEVSDSTEVRVSPSSLRFDTSNWNKAQTITVYGEDDLIRDGLVNSEVKVDNQQAGYAGFEVCRTDESEFACEHN